MVDSLTTDTQSDTQPDTPHAGHDATAPAGRRLARWLELVAIVPVVMALVDVARSPRMQMLDYWAVLARITNPDGSLRLSGIWSLQNEHPTILPSLLYWLDARLFGGDNRVLGVLTVLFAVATVLLLRASLPASLPPLARAGLVVASTALVFSLHGLHNFVRAMSGTAWLLANLIVVVALMLAVRGRWWPAWLVGALACLTYGTAFAVWPALAAVAALKRESWWHRLVPLGVGVVVIAGWALLSPVTPGIDPVDPQWWQVVDPGGLLFTLLAVIGHVWTDGAPAAAVIAGMVVVVGYVGLATTRTARAKPLLVWWAVAIFAFIASGITAAARVNNGPAAGLFSRYTSLSVLMSVPLLVLAAAVVHEVVARRGPVRIAVDVRLAAAVVGCGLLGYSLGAADAAVTRAQNSTSQRTAVALRLEIDDALGGALRHASEVIPQLKAMGHYPFTDDFTLGCGGPELGSRLDETTATLPAVGKREPSGAGGDIEQVKPRTNGAASIRGWAVGPDGDPILCTVLVDGSGTVTGGGASLIGRPEISARFQVPPAVGFAVTGPVDPDTRVAVILTSGTVLTLPGDLTDGQPRAK